MTIALGYSYILYNNLHRIQKAFEVATSLHTMVTPIKAVP